MSMAVASSEECLARAVRHVSDGWLPPQIEVLNTIQSRLNVGAYDNDRALLAKDLKEDFALYMYCLRELTSMLDDEQSEHLYGVSEQARETKHTPKDLIETSTIDKIRAVLSKSNKEISAHSFEEINEFQALRFRESMLSASTAEVLAESVDIDPETGFSCGLLRQLGLTLIAWNYPRVYSRAVEKLADGVSLDLSLKKTLGFSPSLLGLTFARKWNLSDEILAALGDGKASAAVKKNAFSGDPLDAVADNAGATLAKICEVGEALARANDPEHYPTALADWETAVEAIGEHLGPKGVEIVFERAQDNLKQYVKHTPELINFTETDFVRERIVGSQFASRMMEKNTYLKSISPELREELKKLYSRFKPNKILKSNIQSLMKDIIPRAGFSRGVIYMYDPEKRVLAPAVKVGEVSKERLRPVRVSSVLAQFDLIASAYSLKTPLREENVSESGVRLTLIASALGQLTPVGVLLLETNGAADMHGETDAMNVYRAIRQTLMDCLNVS